MSSPAFLLAAFMAVRRAPCSEAEASQLSLIHICASDSSIRDVVPNDLRAITEHAPIERIFCNGNTSLKYYRRYNEPLLGRPAVVLPSTSPANAAWSLQRLAEAWRVIL